MFMWNSRIACIHANCLCVNLSALQDASYLFCYIQQSAACCLFEAGFQLSNAKLVTDSALPDSMKLVLIAAVHLQVGYVLQGNTAAGASTGAAGYGAQRGQGSYGGYNQRYRPY